ncbi:MAG: hypothetical protein LBN99_08495 [Oscillospiraceae bacterium]|jgi:hypothetical protein|nr:hypothetical protein [Oscillospiraceae bacterium]
MQKWIVVAVLVVVFGIVSSIVSSIRNSRWGRERRFKKWQRKQERERERERNERRNEQERNKRDLENKIAYERGTARRELERSAFWGKIKDELRQNAREAFSVDIHSDRGALLCRKTLDDAVSVVELYKISDAERALTATELDALADMCRDELAAFQLESRILYARGIYEDRRHALVTVERPDLVPRRPY